MATNPQMAAVDAIPDGTGDVLGVGVIGDQVVLWVNDGIGVFLGAQQRDRFAKAWAEAERRAEAHLEAAVVEAEIWCGLDGCVNGPGEHQWNVDCQTREEAAG